MLNYFKPIINAFLYDFSKVAYLGVIIVTLSSLVVFFLEVITGIISKTKKDSVYYLCYTLLSLVVTLYFAVEDYFGEKLLFETPKSVYVFMTVLLSLCIIFYTIIRYLSNRKKDKNEDSKVINYFNEQTKPDIEVKVIKPKTYKYFSSDSSISGGYLDVLHLKSLINDLKQKNLSNADYSEIEDLELYLMNFVSRQPNDSERAVLSEKLSMLVKKIALYAS